MMLHLCFISSPLRLLGALSVFGATSSLGGALEHRGSSRIQGGAEAAAWLGCVACNSSE